MGMLKQYRSGAWESRARGGGSGGSGTSFDTNFYIQLSADQAVTTGADRKVVFDTLVVDGNTEWSAGDGWWLCKTSGYYDIGVSFCMLSTYTGQFRPIIYVDGAAAAYGPMLTGISGYNSPSVIAIPNFYIAAASYLEIYTRVTGNTSVESNTSFTWFRITRYK